MKAKLILLSLSVVGMLTACGSKATKQNVENSSTVELQTTAGTITLKLYKDTPQHRENFLKLVNEKYYDGVAFHRIIKDFMIQGGQPNAKNAETMQGDDPGYTIAAEIVYPQHFHKKGVLAAARTGDNVNPERRSSGSQFYIVTGRVFTDEELDMIEQRIGTTFTAEQREAYKTVGGAPHLDGSYTVFGEVIDGMDVVDALGKVQTGPGDKPVGKVEIIKAVVVEDKK